MVFHTSLDRPGQVLTVEVMNSPHVLSQFFFLKQLSFIHGANRDWLTVSSLFIKLSKCVCSVMFVYINPSLNKIKTKMYLGLWMWDDDSMVYISIPLFFIYCFVLLQSSISFLRCLMFTWVNSGSVNFWPFTWYCITTLTIKEYLKDWFVREGQHSTLKC